MMAKRIGVFGGTFDPIHIGHIVAVTDAQQDLALDEVLFVVAKDPWQKVGLIQACALDRLVMADIAVKHLPWATVSTLEIDREGPTYTIDTLEELAADDQQMFLLLGHDQIKNLPTWHRAAEIETLALPYPMIRWCGISSTLLRSRMAVGKTIDHLVPAEVARYINARSLYGTPRSLSVSPTRT